MTLTERYSNIPYVEKGRSRHGVDCYGLLHLVYLQELGIELPLLTAKYRCANKVSYRNVERDKGFFVNWEPVEKPDMFDVGLLEKGGYTHVVICVDKRGQWGMHISEGGHVMVESLKSPAFKHTLRGWYTYAGNPE